MKSLKLKSPKKNNNKHVDTWKTFVDYLDYLMLKSVKDLTTWLDTKKGRKHTKSEFGTPSLDRRDPHDI